MNEKWKKGINDLKNEVMTQAEKELVLSRILNNPPIVSPYITVWNIFIKKHVAFVILVLIFITSTGVVIASEQSLPGNVLYAIKTKVTEPMRDLVKILPADNAQWQAEKANRRLEEAEILAVQNKLDDKKRDKIEVLFDKHTAKFDDALRAINASSTAKLKQRAEKVENDFETDISVHAKVFESVNKKKDLKESKEANILEKKLEEKVSKQSKANANKVEEKEQKREQEQKVDDLVQKRLHSLDKIQKRK